MKEIKVKLTIQYYDDDKLLRIFKPGSAYAIADLKSDLIKTEKDAMQLLKTLGYKVNKIEKTDWGFEVVKNISPQ